MKKKIFGAVVVVAIAVGAMINVNLNKTSNKGDLAMANVDAFAQSLSNSEQWYDWPGANLTGAVYGQKEGSKIVLTGNGTYNSAHTVTTTTATVNGQISGTYVGGVFIPSGSLGGSYTYQVQAYSPQYQSDYTTIPCCKTVNYQSNCGYQPC
jgi:hypothetical protein